MRGFASLRRPKILVIGYARHGKDTVCDMLKHDYGFSFTSSSAFCAEKIILPALRRGVSVSYGPIPEYENAEECFNDRHNHRALWYDLISGYNRNDPSRLGREIFLQHDVYCGLRAKREFHALKNAHAFDVSIWVDRSDVLPPEDTSSMTLEPWMADYVLDNNSDLPSLKEGLKSLMFADWRTAT